MCSLHFCTWGLEMAKLLPVCQIRCWAWKGRSYAFSTGALAFVWSFSDTDRQGLCLHVHNLCSLYDKAEPGSWQENRLIVQLENAIITIRSVNAHSLLRSPEPPWPDNITAECVVPQLHCHSRRTDTRVGYPFSQSYLWLKIPYLDQVTM